MIKAKSYPLSVQVDLPEKTLPVTMRLNPELHMTDDEYFEFCMANPKVRFERSAQGEITIVPPAGGESSFQEMEVSAQLRNWSRRDSRGKAFNATAEYILPTGAALSPDASWVSNERLAKLTKQQLRKFPRVTPEFVIEVMSPSDRLKSAQEKMQEWLRGGVELAWLIHPDEKAVYIYRAGQVEPEKRENIVRVEGEGPLTGFELDLTDVWAGL